MATTSMMNMMVGAAAVGIAVANPMVFPNPKVTLNNGVVMPQISLGNWQYNGSTAAASIELGFKLGITHIDDAYDYGNQLGVGKELAKYPRKSYFLTTKVPPCKTGDCSAITTQNIETDMQQLGVDYIDMMLLHGSDGNGAAPCNEFSCENDLKQYLAMEKFYNDSKIRAIGVSNYCVSCLKCLLPKVNIPPVVNQVQYHAGMTPDPEGLASYCKENKILIQAYSALKDGELISNELLVSIGKAHGVSSAQVAYKWVLSQGVAFSFKTDTEQYMSEDIDLFGFNLTTAELEQLDKPFLPDHPSWSCSS